MGRTHAQHAGQSLRLRTVAVFVLSLLFALQFAPLAQAQAATTPECCMAAEGKGCSMHLHRAAHAQGTGYTLAALQPQCPCTPLAPASMAAHDALSLSASHRKVAFAAESTAGAQTRSLRGVHTAGTGGTRGPPRLTLAA